MAVDPSGNMLERKFAHARSVPDTAFTLRIALKKNTGSIRHVTRLCSV
jgi:hypothetical protein